MLSVKQTIFRSILFLLLSGVLPLGSNAQKSAHFYFLTEHQDALELYDKEKYAAAQAKFDQVTENISDPNDRVRAEAEYYSALCALHLFNKDAQYKLREFIADHPESPWLVPAYFQLGKYNYRRRRYEKSIEWFSKVEDYDLSEEQVAEKYFKVGYSHFKEEQFEKASQHFFEIKDRQGSDYFGPANYYYAHIAYQNGNYQTALEAFLKIRNHPNFREIVPYYLTQIYYLQGKYDDLINYAPPFLDSAGTKRAPEIARLIGEAYYRTERYEAAVPYLEQFAEKTYDISREDHYQLGYAYYKSGQPNKALEQLKKIVNEEDSLAHTAYYHMAHIYLDQEEKNYARNAFRSASRMFFDPEIREESLFNYAKLSYELSFDPYYTAVSAFRQFIEEYPDSDRIEEAYEYLTDLYLTSKNYKVALESLEEIRDKNIRLRTAYQMIAHNLGVQQYQNGRYGAAIRYFNKAGEYPVNPRLQARSLYWKAEALYQQRKFDAAIRAYEIFQKAPRAFVLPLYDLAYYGKGYARFDQKNYEEASLSFRKFADQEKVNPQRRNDALLRIGDCYYVQKEYYKAVDYYREAVDLGKVDRDYALYQLALCNGLMQQEEQKTETLQQLIREHPDSPYLAEAKFQLGRSSLRQEKDQKALEYFNAVVDEHPNARYVKKALLQIGLIHYRKGNTDQALGIFKRIVEENPSYEASREALDRIKDVYVDLGQMEDYNRYVADLEGINISKKEVDIANYESAEKRYMNGEYKAAIKAFDKYLDQFHPANFALNAHFYKAEAEYRLELYEKALKDYEYVIQQPNNKFTEPALASASKLNYREENYEKALQEYQELEKIAEYQANIRAAQIGQMRCHNQLDHHLKAINYADQVLKDEKTPQQVIAEALLIKGKSYIAEKNYEKAMVELQATTDTTDSEFAAEAQYLSAKVHYIREEYKASEKAIFELVHQKPSYDHWVAEGFLLLAENYIALGDLFQARETLQSIIEHHSDPDLTGKAKQLLEKIDELEKEQEAREPLDEEELKIDLGDEEEGYEELFEDTRDTTRSRKIHDPKPSEKD